MQKNYKNIVVIGATSSIAEHCLRLWVDQYEAEITLVGRNQERLDQVAVDLRIRSRDALIRTIQMNFMDANDIQRFTDDLNIDHDIDIVLIAHGYLPSQVDCQNDLNLCQSVMEVNAISPALFAEAFVGHMEKKRKGTIAIFGSVAGDRGRKSNYIYGAAKGLIERYVQGLQHRLAKTGVRVILIKPGPTDTPMTSKLKLEGLHLASVGSVSKSIVNGIHAGWLTIYAPAKWALIMMIVRNLPKFIFNTMNL